MAKRRAGVRLAAIFGVAVAMLAAGASPSLGGVHVPAGFQVDTPIDNVEEPTAIEFAPAPDDRIFVAERSGRILTFDGPDDPVPQVFADFRVRVHAVGDRGLLGLELDPDFPQQPYVYVAYTRDAMINGAEPPPSLYDDTCPDIDPNGDIHTCVVSSRVARLEMDPVTKKAKLDPGDLPLETWKVTSWCQQYTSHSIGDLEFDASGALYAGGGDGASWALADYGQLGGNPCGDPVNEGGALRAQDLRTPATADDPTDYNGTIIRIDPDTGEALPGNPLFNNSAGDVRARRIYAYGLRNPYRFEFRPGTDDLYIQDTGWDNYEEIDRVPPFPVDAPNFGWPCYEGTPRLDAFDFLDLPLCESFYAAGPPEMTFPIYQHGHDGPVYPGDPCPAQRGAASTGLSFQVGDHFPASYDGGMFLADAARGCVWFMQPGPDGTPNPATAEIFATSDTQYEFSPVDIVEGPDGALYMPNFWSNEIVRVRHFAGNAPPSAQLSADRTSGVAPLNVNLDASASSDADGDPLTYEWDLNGDGQYDDASGIDALAQQTYTGSDNVEVGVRVSDSYASDTTRLWLYPGDRPPVPTIDNPSAAFQWAVGDEISFDGSATDLDQGAIQPEDLDWRITLEHCPDQCHTHPHLEVHGQAGGNFIAPLHEPESYLNLRLTATDSRGLSASVEQRLDPHRIDIQLASDPPGVNLTLNSQNSPAPTTVQLISKASANIIAPAQAQIGGLNYVFSGWSDGGGRIHTIAPRDPVTYTATFVPDLVGPIDTLAPETVIDSGPGSTTRNRTPTFLFHSDESGVTFSCSIDRGVPSFGSSTGPDGTHTPSTPLANGRYTFRVRATDEAGNVDASPATRIFTVAAGSSRFEDPVKVRIHSRPSGVRIRVGGKRLSTPVQRLFETGERIRLIAPRWVRRNGRYLTFSHWRHGGAREKIIAAGSTANEVAIYRRGNR